MCQGVTFKRLKNNRMPENINPNTNMSGHSNLLEVVTQKPFQLLIVIWLDIFGMRDLLWDIAVQELYEITI